jgi:hypothetical protein
MPVFLAGLLGYGVFSQVGVGQFSSVGENASQRLVHNADPVDRQPAGTPCGPRDDLLNQLGWLLRVRGHLRRDILGQRRSRERLELQRERIEGGREGEVLPLQGERAADEPQEVLDGEEVGHLLSGDLGDRQPPHADRADGVCWHGRPGESAGGQRVHGVEILHQ